MPRREHESWLCLMREAELLRLALSFGRAHASIPVSEDAGRFQLADGGEQACDAIEASFCAMIYGGIRQRHIVRRGPTERGGYAPDVDGHCFYCTGSGGCYFPGWLAGVPWLGPPGRGGPHGATCQHGVSRQFMHNMALCRQSGSHVVYSL